MRALDWDGQHSRIIRTTLSELLTDERVILYRQAILADIEENTQFRKSVEAILPQLAALSYARPNWLDEAPLLQITNRVAQLELLIVVVDALHNTFASSAALRSEGLRALQSAVDTLFNDPSYTALRTELPALQAQLAEAGSVTVGIDLDADLRPSGAVLVSVQPERWGGGRSLLHRLFGSSSQGPLGPFHRSTGNALGGPQSVLQRDLERLLQKIVQPVGSALERYGHLTSRPFAALEGELAWFLGAASLDERLRAHNVTVCTPGIIPGAERRALLEDMINLPLTLQLLPALTVTNRLEFDPAARILIVTGPNRGGKTTFLRAAGQSQVMFQLGLNVPGRTASLACVDAIFTHFPAPEASLAGAGRLDVEAQRLAAIFAAATPRSLVLLNEPLTSTNEHEALIIAQDVLRGLQLLGARTIFVTHLHALAVDPPPADEDGVEGIQSLVAGVDTKHGGDGRTFRIVPGPPPKTSHAVDIAVKHGLTWPALAERIRQRKC